MDDPADSSGSRDAAESPDPEPPRGLTLEVVHEAGDWDRFGAVGEAVAAAARAIAAAPRLDIGRAEACVALTTDAEIACLNETYRGKPTPTNVLSFPAGAGARGRRRPPAGRHRARGRDDRTRGERARASRRFITCSTSSSTASCTSSASITRPIEMPNTWRPPRSRSWRASVSPIPTATARPGHSGGLQVHEYRSHARQGPSFQSDGRGGPILGRAGWIASLRARLGLQGPPTLRDTLEVALKADDETGAFSAEERGMLLRLLRFGGSRVEDVMVPRADIIAVEESQPLRELLRTFEDAGVSRIPLFHETLDDPRGMVHIKDLFGWLMTEAGQRSSGEPCSAQRPAPAPAETAGAGARERNARRCPPPRAASGALRPVATDHRRPRPPPGALRAAVDAGHATS